MDGWMGYGVVIRGGCWAVVVSHDDDVFLWKRWEGEGCLVE